jgi:uncharacterized protein YjaG (DUF416 family)
MISFAHVEHELEEVYLDRWAIVACIASCAQRLLPQFIGFCEAISQGNPREKSLIEALDYMWSSAMNRFAQDDVTVQALAQCEAQLIEEDEASVIGYPYAEDAIAVVIYGLRFILSNERQDAIWGVRRLYEAVDNFVIQNFGIDSSSLAGESAIIEHPTVQRELKRELRDLREASASAKIVDPAVFAANCALLRSRAKDEGGSVFS